MKKIGDFPLWNAFILEKHAEALLLELIKKAE